MTERVLLLSLEGFQALATCVRTLIKHVPCAGHSDRCRRDAEDTEDEDLAFSKPASNQE